MWVHVPVPWGKYTSPMDPSWDWTSYLPKGSFFLWLPPKRCVKPPRVIRRHHRPPTSKIRKRQRFILRRCRFFTRKLTRRKMGSSKVRSFHEQYWLVDRSFPINGYYKPCADGIILYIYSWCSWIFFENQGRLLFSKTGGECVHYTLTGCPPQACGGSTAILMIFWMFHSLPCKTKVLTAIALQNMSRQP